ncbi:probable LRR receptor-like serine/threonine-protein kinase At3g47570 [Quercus robur]|uniref:probable LRR receptor-like serine/threonine-protein kinase At3g47570 n=1 Tax=Quercus robur TaxID=38942 RepID=UPI0021621CC0|nr:probable LRR receptor-like serine/threonine-protein kinase At3g47570 [Quercus robur]
MASPSHLILQSTLLFVLIFCKCIFLEVESQSATLSIVTDKEALISFKSRIIEPFNPLSSWDQKNSPPCNWTGVVCNKSGQRVVGLDLSGFGLKGSISPHIGNLSFLRSLQLGQNQFTGMLPDQIVNLFHVRVLNLSSNRLEGVLPSNISQLTELQVLDLSENKNITGRIPEEVSYLKNLEVLKLARNYLYGAIPSAIGNLSSLINLNLGTNTLSGAIPSDLGRLQNLKELDLNINNFSGTVPPSIYNISSLVSLALASNNLWGEIPRDVGIKLPNLLVFNFCINKFTGKIPWSLYNLTNIKIIHVADNLLEGTIPPDLGNLPFLEMYDICFNKIVSEDGLSFITSLKNSTRLKFLAIGGNHLEGVIPGSIGNLSKALSKLYMGETHIYGNIPTSIVHLSGLTLLNLSYNSLSGEIPPEIGHLEELQMLVLAGNQLSGSVPNSLGNLQKLNQIDLSGNSLVGNIPTSFGNFQKLLSMDLSNNKFSGKITREIFSLPSLSTILNLSNNFLSGALPEEVSLLVNVVTIDLSNNLFSGNIPSSIRKSKSLQKLLLGRNVLSGPIPSTLEEVRGLDTLDLSSNQLSGSIPVELQNLQALQSLNLSFNNLEGVVPKGGVFGNLSKVHLEGNPKLCLYLACVKTQSNGRKVTKVIVITSVLVSLALCFILGSLFYLKRSKSKITRTSELVKGQHQMVSYNDLRQATGNFNPENFLGNGSFGFVYKGYLRQGIAVAVKVLDTQRTSSWKSFLAECEALRNVRHRNLVKLITSCSSIDFKNMEFLALVYEYLSNGSLEDWVNGKRKNANGDVLNVVERLNVAIDVACALDYLHHDCEVPVVHCDLKPSNILLSEDMTAKVGDFGLARLLMQRTDIEHSISRTNVLKGSIGYIPPEYGMGEKPSTAGDVYSFGIMLLELFTGKRPTHESFIGDLNLVRWVQSAFPANIMQVLDPEMLQLMSSLYHNDQPISPDVQHGCLIIILGVGLSCTVESSDGRISIRSALQNLKSARETLLNQLPLRMPN